MADPRLNGTERNKREGDRSGTIASNVASIPGATILLPSITFLNNPVHHGYAEKWTDWIWSSAGAYLDSVGCDEAERMWKEYPILNYGEKWDKY